jgi:hypothetical protein
MRYRFAGLVGMVIVGVFMSFTNLLERVFTLFGKKPRLGTRLRDGDSLLVSVKDGTIIAQSFDIALSHAEFVKRSLGSLPEGVGG